MTQGLHGCKVEWAKQTGEGRDSEGPRHSVGIRFSLVQQGAVASFRARVGQDTELALTVSSTSRSGMAPVTSPRTQANSAHIKVSNEKEKYNTIYIV